MDFPKKDWTLFKEKIVIWQENQMEKLCCGQQISKSV